MDGLDGSLKNSKCASSVSTAALENNPTRSDFRRGQADNDLAAVPSPLGSPHSSDAGVAGFSGSGGREGDT